MEHSFHCADDASVFAASNAKLKNLVDGRWDARRRSSFTLLKPFLRGIT